MATQHTRRRARTYYETPIFETHDETPNFENQRRAHAVANQIRLHHSHHLKPETLRVASTHEVIHEPQAAHYQTILEPPAAQNYQTQTPELRIAAMEIADEYEDHNDDCMCVDCESYTLAGNPQKHAARFDHTCDDERCRDEDTHAVGEVYCRSCSCEECRAYFTHEPDSDCYCDVCVDYYDNGGVFEHQLCDREGCCDNDNDDTFCVCCDCANCTEHFTNDSDEFNETHETYTPPEPTTHQHFAPLTPALRAQLQEEGRCFRCRQTGHRSYDDDCPNNQWHERRGHVDAPD